MSRSTERVHFEGSPGLHNPGFDSPSQRITHMTTLDAPLTSAGQTRSVKDVSHLATRQSGGHRPSSDFDVIYVEEEDGSKEQRRAVDNRGVGEMRAPASGGTTKTDDMNERRFQPKMDNDTSGSSWSLQVDQSVIRSDKQGTTPVNDQSGPMSDLDKSKIVSWHGGTTPVAVTSQPMTSYGYVVQPAPKVPDYLCMSVCVTVCCCCCFPFGVISILFSFSTKQLVGFRQYAMAQRHSDYTRWSIITCLLLGLLCYGVILAIIILEMERAKRH